MRMHKEHRSMVWSWFVQGVLAGRVGAVMTAKDIAARADALLAEFDKRFNRPPCEACRGDGALHGANCAACGGTGDEPEKSGA